MTDSHASALKFKHAELERKIEEEETRPLPDDRLVHDLKKRKLALKDELARVAEHA